MVQMAGTIFVVFYSLFVFQKVSTMIVIKPFSTILVFFVFNHIFTYFSLSVYKACTLFDYTAFKIATAFSSSFGYKCEYVFQVISTFVCPNLLATS